MTTHIDPCVPIEAAQFHRVLAIELGTSIEYSAETAHAESATVVRLSCTTAGIWLELDDAVTRKSMQRLVELPSVDAGARGRLLALAVAEFVVASWVELRLNDPSPLDPVSRPADDTTVRTATQLAQAHLPITVDTSADQGHGIEWQLGAAMDATVFTSTKSIIPGLSLRLSQRPARQFAFNLALNVAHADLPAVWNKQDLGAVQLTSTSARVSVLYIGRLGLIELAAGVAGRFGLAHLAGRTVRSQLRARSFYAPWGGPAVVMGLAIRADAHLRVFAEIEAGLVTQPAQAAVDSFVVAQLAGAWGSGAIGAAWAF